jgi:predicted component of type VI protein secretion system
MPIRNVLHASAHLKGVTAHSDLRQAGNDSGQLQRPIHAAGSTFAMQLKLMASLTIPFPEGTRTVALRGNRITIGRLPDNTIQIRDRTISAYHAELVNDGDHYVIHDTESTNGVIVTGERVADFHLREDCKVNLGGVICDFTNAEAPATKSDEINPLPSRSEMLTLQQDNADLRAQITTLRDQVASMTKARENATDATQGLEEHDKLVAEVASLRTALHERQTQIERLTSLLAIASRERDTIQRGYDDARASLERSRNGSQEEALPPPVARLAKPAGAPVPNAPSVPSAGGAPAVPKPAAVPATTNGIKPPSAPGLPTPGAAGPSPSLPKPPMSLPGSGTTPVRRPASAVPTAGKIPTAPAKAPAGAAARLVSAGGVGPKGTQKLED